MTRLSWLPSWLTLCLAGLLTIAAGCRGVNDAVGPPADYKPFVQQIEYPDAETAIPMHSPESFAAPPTLANYQDLEPWMLSLDEAIRTALQNSEVMRDLGGRVLTTPQTVATTYDPALQETNPQAGVEAALSQFDAQVAAGLTFARNENKFNNLFFGGGVAALAQNTGDLNLGVSKTAATGTQFAMRNIINYDRNNSPINRFHSVYNQLLQAEVRHPLLQGAGVEFNRIAGPSRIPGVYNGVLVARINNDITLAQFETGVRDLLVEVEQSYWRLFQAYRELDNRQRAREATGKIWDRYNQRWLGGQDPPLNEAQTRRQSYVFQQQVENALTSVFNRERNLRRLMGLGPADGRVIRPITPPTTARVLFDWHGSLTAAMERRVELRQQRWLVRRRELEAVASRNYAKARLDFIGQYGWKGFGDDLFGNRGTPEGSAFADLFGGDLQDWRMGLELTAPLGNRIGYVAVRNAQLQLARERAVLRDQEQLVSHQLAAAVAEMERSLANVRSAANSRDAAASEVRLWGLRVDAGKEEVFQLLDAQQRLADAESSLLNAVTDYNLALLDVEYRRGTLLSYMEVSLSEGGWSNAAHVSAAKQMRRFTPRVIHPIPADQIKVSNGAYPQQRMITTTPDGWSDAESLPPAPANDTDSPSGEQPNGQPKPSNGQAAPGPVHVAPLSYQAPPVRAAPARRLPPVR